ncbi:MAG TPA: ComF family protein [Candidatus Paceibacterota bacterium]|nr:ComF family protein [Candidatus Paceibacterota bacterium]
MNINFFGDIFFPPSCVACGDSLPSGALCAGCRQGVAIFDTLFCGTCAARLPDQKKVCHKDAPYLLGAAASYDDEPLRAAIHALKFQGIKTAAAPIADILASYVARAGIDLAGFTMAPVPLSAERRRARGFNQSALIARPLAKALALPFEEHLLARITHRKPQSDTEDIFERRLNVQGCFVLAPGASAHNKTIVLVDDVVTSGTTFAECARVLKAAGAKKILALAAAKA